MQHPVLSIEDEIINWSWPPRPEDAHKGLFGHVLIIGGSLGMPGSVWLAAMGAFRVGAGMVTIVTSPDYAKNLSSILPEAMVYPMTSSDIVLPLLSKATVCVIGPGLGSDPLVNNIWESVAKTSCPLILDAGAFDFLVKTPKFLSSRVKDNWILTPHPGEAARLLNSSTSIIQADRVKSILELQTRFGGSIVLKGHRSLICSAKRNIYLCSSGNPGMATAGMGDLLTGVIAGMVAQNLSLDWAAKFGVWCHAKSGDLAAREFGQRGLITSDLLPYIQKVVNQPHQYLWS